jgi:hypothetical protein
VSLGVLAVVVSCGGAPGPGGGSGTSSVGSTSDGGLEANAVGVEAEAASPASGTGTLAGPLAFPVRWAWMDPSEPASECGANQVASGGYAATAITLFENDESLLACADGGSNNGASGRFIVIQVATSQYVMLETSNSANPPLPTQALTPGAYTIINEGENDENLCSFPVSAPIAILQVQQFGFYDAQQIAVSGTVTIDNVGPRSIAGSFNVLLGGPYGQTDGGAGQPLSGSFDAAVCP